MANEYEYQGRAGSPLRAVDIRTRSKSKPNIVRRAEDCPPYLVTFVTM